MAHSSYWFRCMPIKVSPPPFEANFVERKKYPSGMIMITPVNEDFIVVTREFAKQRRAFAKDENLCLKSTTKSVWIEQPGYLALHRPDGVMSPIQPVWSEDFIKQKVKVKK